MNRGNLSHIGTGGEISPHDPPISVASRWRSRAIHDPSAFRPYWGTIPTIPSPQWHHVCHVILMIPRVYHMLVPVWHNRTHTIPCARLRHDPSSSIHYAPVGLATIHRRYHRGGSEPIAHDPNSIRHGLTKASPISLNWICPIFSNT